MQKAKAFVFAAEEDFGIIPVEAQACGTPVIAFGKGGGLETVSHNITGIHFAEQTPECLYDAILKFELISNQFCAIEIRKNAERFSVGIFRERFRSLVEKELGTN